MWGAAFRMSRAEDQVMTAIPHQPSETIGGAAKVLSHHGAVYEAYRILQFGFIILPIVAGIDKFVGLLAYWNMYVGSWTTRLTGGHDNLFLMAVGLCEIALGIGIALKPRYFGYVAAAWMCAVILNVLSLNMYYDIAMRDLGLAIAALALARIAGYFDHGWFGGLMRRES
jgi:hypothetical protein